MRQKQHPGAWRCGLHLGVRLPSVLPARQCAGGRPGLCVDLGGSAHRAPVPSKPTIGRSLRVEGMDFNDTPDEARFRAMVRDWIDANAPRHLEPELRRAAFATSGVVSEDPLSASKAWQRKKADAGYACPHWPKEYGGGGFSPIQRVIWSQEEGPYAALSAPFTVGHGMCGPTMMAWADEQQKSRYLPPLAAGEEIWCQLFSEPSAG